MPSEFITLFLTLLFSMFLLALLFTGIDNYFNHATAVTSLEVAKLNTIFMLLCGLCMVIFVTINFTFDSFVTSLFSGDTQRGIVMITLNLVIFYFLKYHMNNRYGLMFSYPGLVVLVEMLAFLILPYISYRFLIEFGKAFRH